MASETKLPQYVAGHKTPLPRAYWLLRAAALFYVAAGFWLMWAASPRVPYADSYRCLTTLLQLPFPDNALAADHGQREILPNLIRIAELRWFAANQLLQIGVGMTLALATLVAIVSSFRGASRGPRTAAVTIVCIGLFWLGNGRKLAHGSESMHLFLVLLCLAIGLRLLCRTPRDATMVPAWIAAALGIVATLSFGSGIACFAAFFVVLALQRASWRLWLPVVTGAGVAAAVLLLGGSDSAGYTHIVLPPLEQLLELLLTMLYGLLHWLGAPFVWALSPLLDTAHAARIPEPFRALALAVATPVEAAFGPHLSARWPATAIGGVALLWLLTATLRTFLRRDAASRERFALGLAWFGCIVGVLFVTARHDHFQQFPEQITAQRYLPWSMICWTGLLLGFVLRSGRAHRTLILTTLAATLFWLPSQVWTGRYMWKQLDTANLTALGAAVGVLDREFPLVETTEKDLLAAVPLLRAGDKAMFAWPETAMLGTTLTAPATAVIMFEVQATAIENRFAATGAAAGNTGSTGSKLRFRCPSAPTKRILLLDAASTVVGLALCTGPDGLCQGWLRGRISAAALRAATLE